MATPKRIMLATFGSWGDLFPAMALAAELRCRGHDAVLCTSESHRQKVEAAGLPFQVIRPDAAPSTAADMAKTMHPRHGPRVVFKEILFPAVRDSYDDLLPLVKNADMLISSEVCYASPLVAEKTGVKFVSYALAPISLFSAYDAPAPPQLPILRLQRLGAPLLPRMFLAVTRRAIAHWWRPVTLVRQQEGLRPAVDPIFIDKHSTLLNLAMFSPLLGAPQRDWPPHTVQTGFPFPADRASARMPMELAEFLDAGPPPVVFTLGSSAVYAAGNFYEESLEAVRRLNCRAVLLTGFATGNLADRTAPENVLIYPYAPHGVLFERAAAVVHQGGVGTTAQALAAGKPMLVVPFSHDQPDNAARVQRLGVARVIPARKYTAARAAAALKDLLADTQMRVRAREVGQQVRAEPGVPAACDAIERILE